MTKSLDLHLVSDSTGETLDMVAKTCLAQFDNIEALRHFWPMVRSERHLERVLHDVERRPGLVLHTILNPAIRDELERRCRHRSIHAVAVLDPVLDALTATTGEYARGRGQREHARDAAYFDSVPASDPIVRFDRALPAYSEIRDGIAEIREAVRSANDLPVDEHERARLLASLGAAQILWEGAQLSVIQIKIGILMAVEEAGKALALTAKAVTAALLVDAIKAFVKNHSGIDLEHL